MLVFRHAYAVVCVLCASCGSSQCCDLHDLQFVNAGRGCNRRPYRRFVDRPRRSDCTAGQMDREAGWWTTSGNIGLPPLASGHVSG